MLPMGHKSKVRDTYATAEAGNIVLLLIRYFSTFQHCGCGNTGLI